MSVIQQAIQRSVTILEKFDVSNQNLRVIYKPSLSNGSDRFQSNRFYGFVTSLRANINIKSIPESILPDLDPVATRTERLTAVRDMEWKSQRKELEIMLRTSQRPWTPLFSLSLLNRLPYYVVNLMPYLTDSLTFDMANDATLAARIINVGYGGLQGNDTVTLFGSVREELTSLPTDMPEISLSSPLSVDINDASQVILSATPDRKQATFINYGNAGKVFMNWGNLAEVGKGITLLPNGGSYEINLSNPYRGIVSAISDSNASLSILECV